MQTTCFRHKNKSTLEIHSIWGEEGAYCNSQTSFYFRDEMWSSQARQRIMEKDGCGGEKESKESHFDMLFQSIYDQKLGL